MRLGRAADFSTPVIAVQVAARYASLQLAPLASGILIRVARAARAHEPRRSIQLCRHTLTHVHCALPLAIEIQLCSAYGWKGCNAKGARRAPRMGLCSLDQGAGGGARALPTRTLSREQHCSRIDNSLLTLRPSVLVFEAAHETCHTHAMARCNLTCAARPCGCTWHPCCCMAS